MDKFCTGCGQALGGPFCTKCGKQSGAISRPSLPFSQKAALRAAVAGVAFALLAWAYGYDAEIARAFSIPVEGAWIGLWLLALGAWHTGELRYEATRRVADGGTFTTR